MFHDIDYSSLIINQLPIMSDLDHCWQQTGICNCIHFVNIFVLIPDPSGDGTSCTNICLHIVRHNWLSHMCLQITYLGSGGWRGGDISKYFFYWSVDPSELVMVLIHYSQTVFALYFWHAGYCASNHGVRIESINDPCPSILLNSAQQGYNAQS